MAILWATTAQSGEPVQGSIYTRWVYSTEEFVLPYGVDWDLQIPYAKHELYEANTDENGFISPEDQEFIDSIVIEMEDPGFRDFIAPWLEEIYAQTWLKLEGIDMIHLAELKIHLDKGEFSEAQNIINLYTHSISDWQRWLKTAFANLKLVDIEV